MSALAGTPLTPRYRCSQRAQRVPVPPNSQREPNERLRDDDDDDDNVAAAEAAKSYMRKTFCACMYIHFFLNGCLVVGFAKHTAAVG